MFTDIYDLNQILSFLIQNGDKINWSFSILVSMVELLKLFRDARYKKVKYNRYFFKKTSKPLNMWLFFNIFMLQQENKNTSCFK